MNSKNALRHRVRAEYSQMSEQERTTIDRKLIDRLLQEPLLAASKRVFLFASTGFEINTHDLIDTLLRSGKIVALPKCEGQGIMHFYEYAGTLKRGRFGILEPESECILTPAEYDIMIVPALAFDSSGNRLGQGGGYYDRYLEKYSCVTIGLCRSCFLLENIPTEWNDYPVDCVITENATIQCKKTELPRKLR